MGLTLFFDRVNQAIKRRRRNRLFFKKTGSRAELVGEITLINRNVKCGNNVTIYPGAFFWGDGLIEIGDNVMIGAGTIIYASKDGGVHIGNNTDIAAQCCIVDAEHGFKKGQLIKEQPSIAEPIYIGNDVLVTTGAKILKGSVIKDGAVIGAQAVVKGTIGENKIAVGVPAKEIKERE